MINKREKAFLSNDLLLQNGAIHEARMKVLCKKFIQEAQKIQGLEEIAQANTEILKDGPRGNSAIVASVSTSTKFDDDSRTTADSILDLWKLKEEYKTQSKPEQKSNKVMLNGKIVEKVERCASEPEVQPLE